MAAGESIGGGVGGGVAAIAAIRPCGRPPTRAMVTIAPTAIAKKEDDFTGPAFWSSAPGLLWVLALALSDIMLKL